MYHHEYHTSLQKNARARATAPLRARSRRRLEREPPPDRHSSARAIADARIDALRDRRDARVRHGLERRRERRVQR